MSELNNNQFELNEEQVQQVAGGSIHLDHSNDIVAVYACTNPDCRRNNHVDFYSGRRARFQCKYCTYQYEVHGKQILDQNGNSARILSWTEH